MTIPKQALNWIDGVEQASQNSEFFPKLNPANGKILCLVTRSNKLDVERAVQAAKRAQPIWADIPPVKRGMILLDFVKKLQGHQDEIAQIVAAETGTSFKDAYGETGGAIQLGLFYASEGQRLYGRTTTSGVLNKYAMTVRQPIGVAGLITAANTPIANVAWKIFPALICGNAAILKGAEDTPLTSWIMGKLIHETEIPLGTLNIVQGFGKEAGAALVEHKDVDLISFTGSTNVGRYIQSIASERLAKVSLELGGKNPLVVCDDANLENAVKWTVLSAFSNAGQRCAAASRIIVFESIYEKFRNMLVERTKNLKVGPGNDDDLGPVINEVQLKNMLAVVEMAVKKGAVILTGGHRLNDAGHRDGFYVAPTLIENVNHGDEISKTELFGPIACLYRAKNFVEALAMANDSHYGLTACIHTNDFSKAIHFSHKVETGVAVVNAGTYGSEPHMPFGGSKNSGNGWREPGTEAIDIYSELKDIYMNIDPNQL